MGRAGLGSGERGPAVDRRPLGARTAAGRPAGRRLDRPLLRRNQGRLGPVGGRRSLILGARDGRSDYVQAHSRPPGAAPSQCRGGRAGHRVRRLAGLPIEATLRLQRSRHLSRSTDGIVWSPPARIPTAQRSSRADFVLPGIGADPNRVGRVAVAYYVYRGGEFLDAGFISSPNGGRNWRPARRLNAQTMRLDWIAQAGGAMVGDYISTSWAGGRAISVFPLASFPGRRLRPAAVRDGHASMNRRTPSERASIRSGTRL